MGTEYGQDFFSQAFIH